MKIQSDVQSETSELNSSVQWVGMQALQTQLALEIGDEFSLVPSYLDIFVSLKENNRGIHMSRLYQLMMNEILNQKISFKKVSQLLKLAIDSQNNISENSYLEIKTNVGLDTKALSSHLSGFRFYPVRLQAQKLKTFQEVHVWLKFQITYSSTCPQSTALAFEVLNEHINLGKELRTLPATPHAQRSVLFVDLLFDGRSNFNLKIHFKELLQQLESTLGTPVQTAVKKADEMAFAKLNSQNTMFCEDAVRKAEALLKRPFWSPLILGYRLKAQHQESLHPHDAVALVKQNYFEPDFEN